MPLKVRLAWATLVRNVVDATALEVVTISPLRERCIYSSQEVGWGRRRLWVRHSRGDPRAQRCRCGGARYRRHISRHKIKKTLVGGCAWVMLNDLRTILWHLVNVCGCAWVMLDAELTHRVWDAGSSMGQHRWCTRRWPCLAARVGSFARDVRVRPHGHARTAMRAFADIFRPPRAPPAAPAAPPLPLRTTP